MKGTYYLFKEGETMLERVFWKPIGEGVSVVMGTNEED